jgi:predicted PurR-regulated permease PerM
LRHSFVCHPRGICFSFCSADTSGHTTREINLNETFEVRKSRTAVRGYIVFTVMLLLALALAWRMREVLELLYVSALFAVVLMPAVQWMMQLKIRDRHLNRPVAILCLLAAVILALTLFFVIGLPPVIHDLHEFATDFPARIPAIIARAKRIPLLDRLGIEEIATKAESALSATAGYVVASVPLLMGRILDLVTALILCIYFMLEGDSAYRWFLSLFPREDASRLDETLQKADLRMSKWLLGQGTLMLILGVSSIVVFGLLHVRYFVLLGILMGLFNLIPVAGAVITVTLACGVAALDSWTKMFGVMIFYIIYVNLENAVLTPRIMRSSVDLMGLTVIIALLIGTALAGIVGALVAVPTAVLVAVLMDEYLVQKEPA